MILGFCFISVGLIRMIFCGEMIFSLLIQRELTRKSEIWTDDDEGLSRTNSSSLSLCSDFHDLTCDKNIGRHDENDLTVTGNICCDDSNDVIRRSDIFRDDSNDVIRSSDIFRDESNDVIRESDIFVSEE